MPDALLDLPASELRDILDAGASAGSWAREVLEKDLWVVWCLDALFRQPDAPDYAFKGGTSLSKVCGVIDRFSEDVDVTVSTNDERILGTDDPLDDAISKTRRKTRNDRAAKNLRAYLTTDLMPYLAEHAATNLPEWHRPTITIDVDASTIRVTYPSIHTQTGAAPYIQRNVLLEFAVY